jgi:hypothetical protein
MIAVPNVLLDSTSRNDFSEMLHHDGQQASFTWRQAYCPAKAEDFAGGRIECELPCGDAQRAHLKRPAEQRPNARQKFHMAERLDEIVICAAVERGYAVGNACPSRNDEDRLVVGSGPGVIDQL